MKATPTSYAVLGTTSCILPAALALCFEMFNRLTWSVATVFYRQRQIPDVFMGRINSLYRFFAWGPMPLGALAGGWLVNRFDDLMGREAALHIPYLFSMVCVVALAVYCAVALKLNQPEPDEGAKTAP